MPKTGQTVRGVHNKRVISKAFDENYVSAYKRGSEIYNEVKNWILNNINLDSKEKIAVILNQMYETEFLAGDEIVRCVRENKVGKSSLYPSSTQSWLSKEDF